MRWQLMLYTVFVEPFTMQPKQKLLVDVCVMWTGWALIFEGNTVEVLQEGLMLPLWGFHEQLFKVVNQVFRKDNIESL